MCVYIAPIHVEDVRSFDYVEGSAPKLRSYKFNLLCMVRDTRKLRSILLCGWVAPVVQY